MHAVAPNRVIHYDFLFMDKGNKDGYSYIMVIQDDFSSYRELIPAQAAEHAVVVNALLSWFSRLELHSQL